MKSALTILAIGAGAIACALALTLAPPHAGPPLSAPCGACAWDAVQPSRIAPPAMTGAPHSNEPKAMHEHLS